MPSLPVGWWHWQQSGKGSVQCDAQAASHVLSEQEELLLSLSGCNPHPEQDEQNSKDPIHGLLRPLDKSTDGRPIQRKDEDKPERHAYEHHDGDEHKHGAG
jgi:hypothetical protein